MKLKEALKHDFIGEHIEVVNATNKDLVGLKGLITDETKNTFVLGDKTLLKDQIEFIANNIKFKGERLCFRPEDRVKKIR